MVQLSAALTFAALASVATAQLTVLVPGGPNLWWVAESSNTLSWTCQTSPYTNFTVLVANSDPKILTSPIAILAQQNNFDCSKTITQDLVNQTPATGYTVQLADPFNSTHIYASSQPFEIKPLGSSYPDPSSTPTAGGSASSTASGTGASAPSASTTKKSGALSLAPGALGALGAAAVAALSLF
jgi:hypothetical protein